MYSPHQIAIVKAVTWSVRIKCQTPLTHYHKLANVLSELHLSTLLSNCGPSRRAHTHAISIGELARSNRSTVDSANESEREEREKKREKEKQNKWPEFQTINYFNISRCCVQMTRNKTHSYTSFGPYITLDSFVPKRTHTHTHIHFMCAIR